MKSTYSINKAFHISSDLQKAYRNLLVDPSNRSSCESRYSSKIARISSGNIWTCPIRSLALLVAVYWFPDGFTPKGWRGIDRGDSSMANGSESIESTTPLLPLGWTPRATEQPVSAGITEDFILAHWLISRVPYENPLGGGWNKFASFFNFSMEASRRKCLATLLQLGQRSVFSTFGWILDHSNPLQISEYYCFRISHNDSRKIEWKKWLDFSE